MADYILKLNNLTKKYKGVNVLDHISLQIERGKIYGLIGQNGAGKTTLLRILTGGCEQSGGEIILSDGSDEKTATRKNLEVFRKRTGSLIENPAFYNSLTAWENLQIHSASCGVNDDAYLKSLLLLVHLDTMGKKKVKDFSLGMKQRLGIAKALVNKPDILLLDEPINGLDPIGIAEVRNLLRKINKEYNITILISSHILSELYQLADEYMFIHQGRLLQIVSSSLLNNEIAAAGITLEDYFVNMVRRHENENTDQM